MRVSVLCPNLSSNAFARAHLLASLFAPEHCVQIAGPILGDGLWRPLADETTVDVTPIPFPEMAFSRSSFHEAVRKHWEIGLWKQRNAPLWNPRNIAKACINAFDVSTDASLLNLWISEWLLNRTKGITVSNRQLQRRFGGRLIPHARDTDALDPGRHDQQTSRALLGLDRSAPIVVFAGTPRSHKGVEDLIDALTLPQASRCHLLVLGIQNTRLDIRLADYAADMLGDRAHLFAPRPMKELGLFLSAATIAAVPQRETPASDGQIPAKLFDAMSMAKPIIATRVGDIPFVLGETGWLVEPRSPASIARAIGDILANPRLAAQRGAAARDRCILRFSERVAREELLRALGDVRPTSAFRTLQRRSSSPTGMEQREEELIQQSPTSSPPV
jgi:glycosyltransferase involved in cell wall biosynthesis